MRSVPVVPVLLAFVLSSLCTAGESTVALGGQPIDSPAQTSTIERASRRDPGGLALDPTIREVAIVGDSILADLHAEGGSRNDIVESAQEALRSRRDSTHVVVRNLAAPGVATRFPAGPGFGTLDSHLTPSFRTVQSFRTW